MSGPPTTIFALDATQDSSPSSSPPPPRRKPAFDLQPLTSTSSASSSPLQTPTLSESYSHLKRNLSFKSLRELEMRELQNAVWRKGGRGEPGEPSRARVGNWDQLLNLGLRVGGRSFVLGCSLRALVNLVVVLLRVTRKKGVSSKLILNALFGLDTLRFGGMLGLFTFLYKSTLHSLPLLPARLRPPLFLHAFLAGLISGLSVIAEKPSRRITIGQQLLVRGLQGVYNTGKSLGYYKGGWGGDLVLFGLASGQIMYSWLMAPEALPLGYRRFVTGASRVSEPCLPVNLTTTRFGYFNLEDVEKALTWKGGPTINNKLLMEDYLEKGKKGDFGPPFAPCELVHPWVDSCSWTAVDRWQSVFRWMFPVYAALHVIPPMLLRHKLFLKNPKRVLLKSALGTLRSCSFLATFVTLFQGLVCSQRNIYLRFHGKMPKWFEKVLMSRGYYWFAGFMTCLSLFLEEKKRRGELAMYVLPRGLESLWSILRKRSWVPFVPGGEVLMTAVGMAMVMNTYEHHPGMLSGLVRSVLWQFLGR